MDNDDTGVDFTLPADVVDSVVVTIDGVLDLSIMDGQFKVQMKATDDEQREVLTRMAEKIQTGSSFQLRLMTKG